MSIRIGDARIGDHMALAGRSLRVDKETETGMNAIDKGIRISLATAGLVVALSAPAWATRNGELDPGFGNQGKAVLAFPGNLFLGNSVVSVAMQSSGQTIVAATVINVAGNEDFAAIRLDADGDLDTSYGSSGGRRVGFDRANSDLNDTVGGLLVQPDDKVILIGTAAGDPAIGGSDMALVRLTAAGNLDTSFGTGGRVLVPFNLGSVGEREDEGVRVSLQGDGKILVVGIVDGSDGSRDMAVVRLTSNGQRDTTFDGDGRVTIDFGSDYIFSGGQQVHQLADGEHIVVAGFVALSPIGADFALARLNNDGSLDMGFAEEGKAVFDFAFGGNSQEAVYDFIELPGGELLACGSVEVSAGPLSQDMGCVQLLANGSPDPSFPAVVVPFDRGGNQNDIAFKMDRDNQGRILLAGAVERTTSNYDFGVARLLPDGNLDTGFGNGGTTTYNSCISVCVPAEYGNVATGLAIQPDGRIVVAGAVANGDDDIRFMVVRVFGDVLFSHGFEP
jgi:uncharacterized delta-60 repeat protein